MAKNENCVISDSSVCVWLDKPCSECYVDKLKTNDDKEKVLSDFEVMLSLIPNDFDELQGEECQFCKGRKKSRAGYALIDLGHSEPEHKKGAFFGLGKKIRQRIGSLLPVNISICRDCRRALRLVDSIKWLFIVGMVALAVGLLFVPEINKAVAYADSPLPYVIVIGGGVLGYLLGKVTSAAYLKAKSESICFNVFDIPICAKMKEMGWFTVQDDTPATRFVFSRKPFVKKIGELKNTAFKNDNDDFTQTSFLED